MILQSSVENFTLMVSLIFLMTFPFAVVHGKSNGDHIIVPVATLQPPSGCTRSDLPKGQTSLRIVAKHGPCNKEQNYQENSPTSLEILSMDKSRVALIHSTTTHESCQNDLSSTFQKYYSRRLLFHSLCTIQLKSAIPHEYYGYIVTVGLGSPMKEVKLIVDTGSDLSWVRCQPSANQQREPIFHRAQSSTYVDIAYGSDDCQELFSVTGLTLPRLSNTCPYKIYYADGSLSHGNFAKEKLTLSANAVLDEFKFGCSQYIEGNFGTTGGMFGLAGTPISIVFQLHKKFGIGKSFTYCLPTLGSSNGYLSFGTNDGFPSSVKFTPRVEGRDKSYYYVKLRGITVGGRRLEISEKVFFDAGTIIDSGTVITRLPETAYVALREAFRSEMKEYPRTDDFEILDTCYRLSGGFVTLPKIEFIFAPNVVVEVPRSGILWAVDPSVQCLAFAPNQVGTKEVIIGSVQQMTMNIVHDLGGSRIGFGPGGCD